MNAVADIFDLDKDGYIDYQEFMTALRPDRVRAGPGSGQLRWLLKRMTVLYLMYGVSLTKINPSNLNVLRVLI